MATKNRAGSCGCCGGACRSSVVLGASGSFVAMDEDTELAFQSGKFVFDGCIRPAQKIRSEAYTLKWQSASGLFDIVLGKETDVDAEHITIDCASASLGTSIDGAPLPADSMVDFELYVTPSHVYISAQGAIFEEGELLSFWNMAESGAGIPITGDWYIDGAGEISAVTIIDSKYIAGEGDGYGYEPPGQYCFTPRCSISGHFHYDMYQRMKRPGFPGRLFYDATWTGHAGIVFGQNGTIAGSPAFIDCAFAGDIALEQGVCPSRTYEIEHSGVTAMHHYFSDTSECICEPLYWAYSNSERSIFPISSSLGFDLQSVVDEVGSYPKCQWTAALSTGISVVRFNPPDGNDACGYNVQRIKEGNATVSFGPKGMRSTFLLQVTGSVTVDEHEFFDDGTNQCYEPGTDSRWLIYQQMTNNDLPDISANWSY